MALITCPECGKENVSNTAVACPACGFGIKEFFEKEASTPAQSAVVEETLPAEILSDSEQSSEPVIFDPAYTENNSSSTDSPVQPKTTKKRKIAIFAALTVLCIIIVTLFADPVKTKSPETLPIGRWECIAVDDGSDIYTSDEATSMFSIKITETNFTIYINGDATTTTWSYMGEESGSYFYDVEDAGFMSIVGDPNQQFYGNLYYSPDYNTSLLMERD